MFVPNFEAIGRVTSVLGPKNRPEVRCTKRSHLKTALVRQKIFHTVIHLKVHFHPNQPTFGRDEVFSFFFPS